MIPAVNKINNNQKKHWAFLCIILLIIVCCANPWQLYFLNDDFIEIPLAFNGTIGHHNSLRHVNDFSLYLDSLLSKENAVGYHITNLLLHIANIFLGIVLLKKIGSSLSVQLGRSQLITITSLFGIYAFHSEALFWIICRTASLSFFFNSISWLCLFKSLQKRWWWIMPMSIAFLLGIFTYEAVWVFPFWLLVWYLLLPKTNPQRSKAILPISIISTLFILYFPLRLQVTGELLGSYEAGNVQRVQILPILEKSFKLFARSFLPPVSNHKLFLLLFAVVLLGLAGMVWLLLKSKKTDRLFCFFVLAWLISYFPYISLGISTSGYSSERYLYFPSFFLCAVLIYGAGLLWQSSSLKKTAFIICVFAYQLFFFIKASQDFKMISRYTRESIAAIKSVPLSQKIVISNLPAYSYGVPVFNYGFASAVAWMAPCRDTASVIVKNKTNFERDRIVVATHTGATADTLVFVGQ